MEKGVWFRYLKYMSHVHIRLNHYNIFTWIPTEVKFYWSNRSEIRLSALEAGRREGGRERGREWERKPRKMSLEWGRKNMANLRRKKWSCWWLFLHCSIYFFQVYKYVKSSTEENCLQMQNSKKNKIKRRSKTALKRLSLKWWMEISFPFHCYLVNWGPISTIHRNMNWF